jgi:hypothetical protein
MKPAADLAPKSRASDPGKNGVIQTPPPRLPPPENLVGNTDEKLLPWLGQHGRKTSA